MKNRKWILVVVSLAGLGLMASAFLVNASPYVTIAQAKTMKGDNLHLAGDMMPDSVKVITSKMRVEFALKDSDGQVVPVVYQGTPPSNMGAATKVVAIGRYENNQFVARQLLMKCPSKYESSDQKTGSEGKY